MSEWFKGFLSGVIATIIGCVITMVWDIFKSKRETEERENKVLAVIKEDLTCNLRILVDNLELIKKELEIIGNGSSIINSLIPLKTGFWDLAKIHLPKKILQGDTLAKLRDVVMNTERINETIQSRENFRNHNRALNGYGHQMKSYDNLLVDHIKCMLDLTKKVSSFLND